MKTLITLILFASLSVVAATKEQLTFDLITAAQSDNLAQAIQLLNEGADPVKTVQHNGQTLTPAIYQAALSAARFGKDSVYKELIHRGVSINTAVNLGWGDAVPVWEFLLSEVGQDKAKFENFFLQMLKDGANPFAQTLYSNTFAYLVFGDYAKVLTEVTKKEIRKESWLWYTHNWSMRYKNFAGEDVPMQKLMDQFEKNYPVLQKAGVSINEWGFYGQDEEKPGPVLFLQPVAAEFVRYKMNTKFINAFVAYGFDVNKVIYKDYSMCGLANVISIQDVNDLVGLGCQTTNRWTLSALLAEQYKTAEKVLSLGINIDQPFLVYGTSHTVLTFLRSLDTKPQVMIDWTIKHGANPNQPQPVEKP